MKVVGLLLIFFVLRANSVSRIFRPRYSIRGRTGNGEIAGTDGSASSNAVNVLCSVKTIIDSTADQILSKCKDLPDSNDQETKGAKAKCSASIRNLNSLSRGLPNSCPDSSKTLDSRTTLAVEATMKDSTSPTTVVFATPYVTTPAATEPEETTTYTPASTTMEITTPYISTTELEETTTEDFPTSTTVEPTTESSETSTTAETTTQYTTTTTMAELTKESNQCNENLRKKCDDHCLDGSKHRRINLGGSCTIGERNSVRCKCIKVTNCEVFHSAPCQDKCRKKSSDGYCRIPEKNIPCACSFHSETSNTVYFELPD